MEIDMKSLSIRNRIIISQVNIAIKQLHFGAFDLTNVKSVKGLSILIMKNVYHFSDDTKYT